MSSSFFQVLSSPNKIEGDVLTVTVALDAVGPYITYRGYDSVVSFGGISPTTYMGSDILWAYTILDSRTPEQLQFVFALDGSHPQDLFEWLEPEDGPKYPSVSDTGPDFFTLFTDFGTHSVWQFAMASPPPQYWPNSGTRTITIT